MEEYNIGQTIYLIENGKIFSARVIGGVGPIDEDSFRFRVCSLRLEYDNYSSVRDLLDNEIFDTYEEASNVLIRNPK